MAQAVFGAGCFWGIQLNFDAVPGVTQTSVGYAGGHTDYPTYKEVCSDRSGHAEVVHITFDETVVSYDQLLDTLFAMHDPTQVNRQGPDYGSQYRSVIYYYDRPQQLAAQVAMTCWQEKFNKPLATELSPAPQFWPAEDYHQKYLEKKGKTITCH